MKAISCIEKWTAVWIESQLFSVFRCISFEFPRMMASIMTFHFQTRHPIYPYNRMENRAVVSRENMRKFATLKSLFIVLLVIQALGVNAGSCSQCKAWIVQSIPTDMPHLPPVSGVLSTGIFFCFTSIFVVWVRGKSGEVVKVKEKIHILFLSFCSVCSARGLLLCGFFFSHSILFIVLFGLHLFVSRKSVGNEMKILAPGFLIVSY